MRVLLVYPNITDYPIDISFGLAAISSFLKSFGHKIKLLDCTFGCYEKEIESTVLSFAPQIIGIPVASNDFEFTIKICSLLKRVSDATIVAGGFHATLAPDDILAENCFDIVVVGEGEQSFLQIIEAKESNNYKALYDIPGICFKINGSIIKNIIRPLNRNINALPFPDKPLFDYQRYININRGLATFITSYGCPYECTYCINKSLIDKFGSQGFVRYKSVDYLIEEIKSVVGKYKVREIEFYDDTFTANEKRTEQFCAAYNRDIKIPFCINARVDTINGSVVNKLKDAGCTRISMGIETGDSYVRNEVLNRNQSDAQIIDAFKIVRAAGLKTLSYSMVGIPYETKDSIQKSIEINRKCRPDFIVISIFNAYKGTEIYEDCKRNGWLRHDKGTAYFQTSNIKHPNFTLRELKNIRDSFGYHVFKAYDYKRAVIDLVDKILLANRNYQMCRSYLIRHGIKKYL